MHRPAQSRERPGGGARIDAADEGPVGTRRWDERAQSSSEVAPSGWFVALVYAASVLILILIAPIYWLNRWDFDRKRRRNPLYTSALVRLQDRYPMLYELAILAWNFPAWHRIYDALPRLSGDVLQVGCGTGLLNRHVGPRPEVRFTNLDTNLHALRFGARLGRYTQYVHAPIDRPTPLPDRSFDVVVFARSFHHVRNHRKALGECARLLRDGGAVIILDPVMLRDDGPGARPAGFLVNTSLDGVVWRFTRETLLDHLKARIPETLRIESIDCFRQLHVSNYNPIAPHTDAVAVLVKGGRRDAEGLDPADGAVRA